MKEIFKKIKHHLVVLLLFLVVSFAYFSPMLSGNILIGGDTKNWIGMSQDLRNYKAKYKETSSWTNSIFSGMPSYMINGVKANKITEILVYGFNKIPKPAGHLFFLFLGFYILLLSFKVDYKMAVLGSLMFGFSSYFLIIIGVGHVTKTMTIYYTVFLIAGINYILDRRYTIGFLIASVFAILSINANHPQMSYYYGFAIVILFLFKFFEFRKNDLKHYFISVLLVSLSAIIAVLVHSNNLVPLTEYTKETIRGKANLTEEKLDEKEKTSGLDRSYITAWSYGKMESFNMFIPNLMGKGSEGFDKKSEVYKSIVKSYQKGEINQDEANSFLSYARSYWGPQPFTEGPTYVGAVVVFLFFLGIFILNGPTKWWLLSATIFSFMIAWGKYLGWFTDFMIDYFPLYNKFRAPSSALVVAQMTIPLIGILGLKEFLLNKEISLDKKQKALKYSTIISLGICIIFGLGGLGILEYVGGVYDYIFEKAPELIKSSLIKDRESITKSDSWRTFIFVLIAVGTLFMYLKNKLNYIKVIVIIGLLSLVDMWSIGKRYINEKNFIPQAKYKQLFIPSFANKEIMKDTTYYRVMNTTKNIMNDSETSYWHNSIGGYHAAKLRRYQELWDRQISKQNTEVINMLNVKYIIVPDSKTGDRPSLNLEANGNAWLVNNYIYAENSDQEMKILDSLKTKEQIVLDREYENILGTQVFEKDETAYIKLASQNLQELKYDYFSEKPQIVVFSEIYYKQGWKAYVDGQLRPYFRANYLLRAITMEKGKHQIVFKYESEIEKKGILLSNVGYVMFFISILSIMFFRYKR